jgi:hypothetical protein
MEESWNAPPRCGAALNVFCEREVVVVLSRRGSKSQSSTYSTCNGFVRR